jgi:sulfatase maturation enzyme AslB (radical SAM superfamily)
MLTSNGLLYDKWREAIIRYCNDVAVSIDGMAAHDKIRGVKGLFDKAMGMVEELARLKPGLHTLHTRVSFAICPDNQFEIVDTFEALNKIGVSMVFNHYNYIPGRVNTYYDLKQMDIETLFHSVNYCAAKGAKFLPLLVTKEELRRYYHEVPTQRVKRPGGCEVINKVIKGTRFSLVANGDFIPSVRCWFDAEMGNATVRFKPELTKLKELAQDIIDNGFPVECQRLCCAGNLVGEG